MDLNVKVALRCRPMSSKEKARNCTTIVKVPSETTVIMTHVESNEEKKFTFDHCYFTESTQEHVYRDIGAPMVKQALDGYNSTMFAYGQTGSGKTYSMMGALDEHRGIIPRLNEDLWNKVAETLLIKNNESNAGESTKIMITVSFLEIYNEVIKDLLNPSDKSLKIRESPSFGIYVEDLCDLIVRNYSDVMRLLEQGNTVRRVASTNMNETSSRSHSVFTIRIEQKTITELGEGGTREILVKAKINLVDLAGSERATKTGATGSTLKEGANINMSLMALGNVINALSEISSKGTGAIKTHIPYRDSKLTRLLQESLGGNSATVMLAAISPADYNYDETMSTLKYANRAKSIANAVTRNEDHQERMIKDLKNQIDELKKLLDSGKGHSGEVDEELENKLLDLERERNNVWGEKEALSKALELERQSNLNTAMSSMLENVKEQKVTHMKNIKRLTNEKVTVSKKLKEIKISNEKLKAEILSITDLYEILQTKYDEISMLNDTDGSEETVVHDNKLKELASNMITYLNDIEEKKTIWTSDKTLLKTYKDRLALIDEEIIDERAELVSTSGLLDQNEKLRAQIQSEERLKMQSVIESEIASEKIKLGIEFQELNHQQQQQQLEKIENLMKSLNFAELEIANYKDKNLQLQQDVTILQLRLVDAEVNLELSQAKEIILLKEKEDIEILLKVPVLETETVLNEIKIQCDKAVLIANEKNSKEMIILNQINDEKNYQLFQNLMDKFEDERQMYIEEIQKSESLLANASKDLIYLSKYNETLQKELRDASLYEAPIKPSHSNYYSKVNNNNNNNNFYPTEKSENIDDDIDSDIDNAIIQDKLKAKLKVDPVALINSSRSQNLSLKKSGSAARLAYILNKKK